MKRTPLKRYTRLAARKPINKISDKQKLRNKVLAAIAPPENNCCQKCGKFAPLSKHHIIFRSQGGTDDPGNIIWLCRDCHDRAHNR